MALRRAISSGERAVVAAAERAKGEVTEEGVMGDEDDKEGNVDE